MLKTKIFPYIVKNIASSFDFNKELDVMLEKHAKRLVRKIQKNLMLTSLVQREVTNER